MEPSKEVRQNPPDADPEAIAVAATMRANGLASDAGFLHTSYEKTPNSKEGVPGNQ